MNKMEAEAVIKDTIEYANQEIEKNKKKMRRYMFAAILGFVLLAAVCLAYFKANPSVKSEESDVTILVEYSHNSDGTWECGGNTYQYKLVITGRMPNAMWDSTFVYLSNRKDITLEQAWNAAGFSSNSEDYFAPEDAVLVGWKLK